METLKECFDLISNPDKISDKFIQNVNPNDEYWNLGYYINSLLSLSIKGNVKWNKDNIGKLLKSLIDISDISKDSLDERIYKMREKLFDNNEFDVNKDIEFDNFLIYLKLFEIPLYEENTVANVMRIALTLRQIAIHPPDKKYINFLKENKMDKLETYVKEADLNKNDIEIVNLFMKKMEDYNEEINNKYKVQNGGGNKKLLNSTGGINKKYFHLYKIYKSKYLNLKHLTI